MLFPGNLLNIDNHFGAIWCFLTQFIDLPTSFVAIRLQFVAWQAEKKLQSEKLIAEIAYVTQVSLDLSAEFGQESNTLWSSVAYLEICEGGRHK